MLKDWSRQASFDLRTAVAEGVRLLMSQQQLRAEIQKGIEELDAGQGIDGEEVFAELRERAKKLMESAE